MNLHISTENTTSPWDKERNIVSCMGAKMSCKFSFSINKQNLSTTTKVNDTTMHLEAVNRWHYNNPKYQFKLEWNEMEPVAVQLCVELQSIKDVSTYNDTSPIKCSRTTLR